jgi:glycosyltransferase involved in cell wall biosynthesis
MKVCMLTSAHSALDDRIFYREARSLSRAGYHAIVIAPHPCDEESEGVEIKAITKEARRLARITRSVWAVYRQAVRQNAQVYHFHDPELIPLGLLLRAQAKKVVYDIHEDVPRQILSKYYLPRWIRRPLSWLVERFENSACRCFSALVTNTPAIANRFRQLNSHTLVIQNLPLREEYLTLENSWQDRSPHVCYAGGISAIRGIRQMVNAMGLLPENLQAKLMLAGTFSPASLRNELALLPGWKRVETLGFLERRSVYELLTHARAGLVVVLPEPNHVKSRPVKLFEYMSAGTPVIASDFPEWREIIEECGCGLVVDPLDPEAIAEAINYLCTHPKEAETMGRLGRKAVDEKYNWSSEEKKLLSLYQEILPKA